MPNRPRPPFAVQRTLFRQVLLLALAIALVNALLPTALRIVSAARGEQVVTICSTFGVKQMSVDAASGQPAGSTESGESCPYCLASQLACLPANDHPAPSHIAAVSTVSAHPAGTDFVKRPYWPSARPRAPPSLS